MLSYHNNPELKAKAVESAKRHRDADMLLAGTYGEMNGHFKGCSVGCDAYDITGKVENKNAHAITADHYGLPEWLERLRDTLFEGLPEPDRYEFHVQLKEAIPVGVALEPVRHILAIRRLDRLIDLQMSNTGYDATDVVAALKTVKLCHEVEMGGGSCDWSAARSAAWAAWAAWSAESAARSAESAESAAAWAAWSAESARSAAWSAACQQERDDLLEILRGMAA